MRKSAAKLTEENIEITFTKKIPKCNIVAIFIRQTRISEEKEKISHEYFTKEQLSIIIILLSFSSTSPPPPPLPYITTPYLPHLPSLLLH